jgi:hypothetical protein
MYVLCEDLCHCAISIFYQDLMRSNLTIANWYQVQ